MSQSNANKWIHVLLLVLHQTIGDLRDLPARHLQELALRLEALGVSETPPLFTTTGLNDRSRAPRTTMSKKRIIAVRSSATP
jgi:hypothetical protein